MDRYDVDRMIRDAVDRERSARKNAISELRRELDDERAARRESDDALASACQQRAEYSANAI